MRHASLIISFCIIAACTATQPSSQAAPTGSNEDACRAAIEETANLLDEESVKTLLTTKKEDLIQYHIGWGTGIRNDLGFWREDSLVRKSCAALVGEEDIHPESASGVVMEGVWDLIHARNRQQHN